MAGFIIYEVPLLLLPIIALVGVGMFCCFGTGDDDTSSSGYSNSQGYNDYQRYDHVQIRKPKENKNYEWKDCPGCGHKINSVAKKCPYCDYEF